MFSLSCQDGEILRFVQVTILCVIDSAASSYDLNACAFAYSTAKRKTGLQKEMTETAEDANGSSQAHTRSIF